MDSHMAAMTNRSLRTVRNELEYLADASVITHEQLSTILAQLPDHTPLSSRTSSTVPPIRSPMALPTSITDRFSNIHFNGKQNIPQEPSPSPAPPPSYGAPQSDPPQLAFATALYAYNPTDSGDCALQPNDRIAVLEYTNAEWWKGRNERTKQEGIFPRNYVKVEEEKSGYGNLPLEVSQGETNGSGGQGPSKMQQQGKKFGKKLGNAAIFGAGMTIGSDIVDAIL